MQDRPQIYKVEGKDRSTYVYKWYKDICEKCKRI